MAFCHQRLHNYYLSGYLEVLKFRMALIGAIDKKEAAV